MRENLGLGALLRRDRTAVAGAVDLEATYAAVLAVQREAVPEMQEFYLGSN
jgi:hypothetical protein